MWLLKVQFALFLFMRRTKTLKKWYYSNLIKKIVLNY